MKYDVFVSYSRKDYVDEQKQVIPGNVVSKVKDALTNAGITYWFDEEGIYYGQNFVDKIVTNIEDAKIFLFLSTANSNKSPWTCKEIASADEFKKHIIPVRIDPTPYSKKVLFRIADLDYIEYYVNPEKGIEDMIESIQVYLKEFAAEEERKLAKEEELRQQKEQQERRKKEEQERLVSEIKLACATINNAEDKLELDREDLLLRVKGVVDSLQRDDLSVMIKRGGTIHQQYQKQISSLNSEMQASQIRENEHENQIRDLQEALNVANAGNSEQNKGLETSDWIHFLYGIVILLIISVSVSLGLSYNSIAKELSKTKHDLERTPELYEQAEQTLSTISSYSPIIITDIQIANSDATDSIYFGKKKNSANTLYLTASVKYIGVDSGTQKFEFKWCKPSEVKNNSDSYSGYYAISTGTNILYSNKWHGYIDGFWPAGTYRFEVWYDGKKLAEKSFEIY